jgi:hypothetical protein
MTILDTVLDYFIKYDLIEKFLYNLELPGNTYDDKWGNCIIGNAFTWSNTDEGNSFWQDHDIALVRLCEDFDEIEFSSLEVITLLQQHLNPATASYEYW